MNATAPRPEFYRMTLAEFRRKAFIGRPPCINTIKAIIDRKEWLGERVGGLYFIFVDDQAQPLRGTPQAIGTGNQGADRIIMEWRNQQ